MIMLARSMVLFMVIACSRALANECGEAEDVLPVIRMSIARVAVPLMCEELDKRNILKMRMGPPEKNSHILMSAGRLVQEIEILKESSSRTRAGDIAYLDAWRALFVTLGKWDEFGSPEVAAYYCAAGISLNPRDYAEPERSTEGGLAKTLWYRKTPNIVPALSLIIERECNLIRSKSAPAEIDGDSLSSVEDAIKGSRLVDVFPYTGDIKEVKSEEFLPDTWVKLHPVGLTPRNVFSSSGGREVVLDLLEEFFTRAEDKYGKKIFSNRTAEAIAPLREWYRFQDGLLNGSASVDQLTRSIAELQDESRRAELNALRKESLESHFFLTGCIYGPLLTSDDFVKLLEELIVQKKAAAPQLLFNRAGAFSYLCSAPARHGVVYCSTRSSRVDVTTKAVKNALKGKSASEVKEYFGRKPDDVQGVIWVYRGDFYDEAAEVRYPQARVVVIDEKVVDVLFSKEQVR